MIDTNKLDQINRLSKLARNNNLDKDYVNARKNAMTALGLLRQCMETSDDVSLPQLKETFDILVDFVKDIDSNNGGLKQKRQKNISNDKISLTDIIGHKTAKMEIFENLIDPIRNPEGYKKYNIQISNGLLMYGPPGTGKTSIAKAVANEIDAEFFHVMCSEIVDKYVGESEKKIKELFDEAATHKLSIIFFDEFDSMASLRDNGGSSDVSVRLVSQIKTLLDGMGSHENIYILAATNYPNSIEMGIRRRLIPVYVGMPSSKDIVDLLKLKTIGMPVDSNINYEVLGKSLVGYSGDDIEKVVNYAAKVALRREMTGKTDKLNKITLDDMNQGIKRVPLSVTEQDLYRYKEFKLKTKKD